MRHHCASWLLLALTTPLLGQTIVPLSGNVHDGNVGPLTAGNVYVLSGDPQVPIGETLTIQAGAILKFDGNGLAVLGVLNCLGTSTDPVVFTSIADDSDGGDTNFDGPSIGSPGDWGSLNLTVLSSGSTVRHTILRYGGNQGNALGLFGDATVEDSTIDSSQGDGVSLLNGEKGANFRRNIVKNCGGAAIVGMPWEALTRSFGNFAGDNAGGDFIEVVGGDVVEVLRIGSENIVGDVLVTVGVTTVKSSGELRLDPESPMVIKAKANTGTAIVVEGVAELPFQERLPDNTGNAILLGTILGQTLTFTSSNDDSIGGDTFKDGNAVPPKPSDWGGITFEALSDGLITNTEIRYAFKGLKSTSPNVKISNVSVSDCVVGMQVTELDGDLCSVSITDCQSNGLETLNLNYNVCNATVANNGGTGMANFGAGIPTGIIRNSCFWDNGTNVSNLDPSLFSYCNGVSPGTNDNIDVDPNFVDPNNRDYRLQPNSKLIDAGDPNDLPNGRLPGDDIFEQSLGAVDGNLDGVPRIDMGRNEYSPWSLDGDGTPPEPGNTLMFTVTGPMDSQAIVAVGLLDGDPLPIWPFGTLLLGSSVAAISPPGLAMGTPVSLPIPNDTALTGLAFGVQALGFKVNPSIVGNLTRMFVAIIQ